MNLLTCDMFRNRRLATILIPYEDEKSGEGGFWHTVVMLKFVYAQNSQRYYCIGCGSDIRFY